MSPVEFLTSSSAIELFFCCCRDRVESTIGYITCSSCLGCVIVSTTIANYSTTKMCVMLQLSNLTQENPQHEDQYLDKVLLAVTKKAITKKLCKEDCPTLRHWLDIFEEM